MGSRKMSRASSTSAMVARVLLIAAIVAAAGARERLVLYTSEHCVTPPCTARLARSRYHMEFNEVERVRRGGIEEKDVEGAWHGQQGQDKVIWALWGEKRDGYFVDLAAHTPVFLSNSRTLERDFGWQGLCIEGDHKYFVELAHSRSCSVVQAVVASHANESIIYRHQHSYSGVVLNRRPPHGRVLRQPPVTGQTVQKTMSFEGVLRAAGAPPVIDYLSLDVEGFEDEILHHFPFDRDHTFLAMTVERPKKSLMDVLLANNYTAVDVRRFTFGDVLFIHHAFPGGVDAAVSRVSDAKIQTRAGRA